MMNKEPVPVNFYQVSLIMKNSEQKFDLVFSL